MSTIQCANACQNVPATPWPASCVHAEGRGVHADSRRTSAFACTPRAALFYKPASRWTCGSHTMCKSKKGHAGPLCAKSGLQNYQWPAQPASWNQLAAGHLWLWVASSRVLACRARNKPAGSQPIACSLCKPDLHKTGELQKCPGGRTHTLQPSWPINPPSRCLPHFSSELCLPECASEARALWSNARPPGDPQHTWQLLPTSGDASQQATATCDEENQ